MGVFNKKLIKHDSEFETLYFRIRVSEDYLNDINCDTEWDSIRQKIYSDFMLDARRRLEKEGIHADIKILDIKRGSIIILLAVTCTAIQFVSSIPGLIDIVNTVHTAIERAILTPPERFHINPARRKKDMTRSA